MGTPIETVTAFLTEWSKSPEAMRASYHHYFTDATVWENVGVGTTTGVNEALKLLNEFEVGFGIATVKVDMIGMAAAGNIVFNERIDRMIAADGSEIFSIRLMGVFEIEDGKIARWRDYFDTAALPASRPPRGAGLPV